MHTPSAVAAEPVIRVRGLTKRYGEVFGLLGPNGAGKTTTVEILEGLRSPDGGQATVLGVDVARGADSLRPRIGVSLQTAALYPKLTVVEVIDLFRSCHRQPPTGPNRQTWIPAANPGFRRSIHRWAGMATPMHRIGPESWPSGDAHAHNLLGSGWTGRIARQDWPLHSLGGCSANSTLAGRGGAT